MGARLKIQSGSKHGLFNATRTNGNPAFFAVMHGVHVIHLCSAIAGFLGSNQTLAEVCAAIGCNDLILSEDFPQREQTRADTVRALIGANLADNGAQHTRRFVIDFLATRLQSEDLFDVWTLAEPEQTLRRLLANDGRAPAEARLLRETGRNTLIACYVVGFYSDRQLLGSGPGRSVAEAQEMAAYDSLRRMFRLTTASTLFKYGAAAYELDYDSFSAPGRPIAEWSIASGESEPDAQRLIS